MHIAICDDNPRELKRLSSVIDKYISTSKYPMHYELFSDADHLLRAAKSSQLGHHFTHYFLDVMMPGLDGISAAREIRSFDNSAKIIFLTSFMEYAYQGYRVRAYDYLLKSAGEDELIALLERLQSQDENDAPSICLQNGRSLFRIPLSKLSHMEVSQKRLYFYMTNGQVHQIPGTMAEFEKELLAHPGFVKIHRSYIINLNHASIISPEGCIMLSGKNLPISRLLYNQVRSDYLAHLFGKREV